MPDNQQSAIYKPELSIVIPSYNRPDLLRVCLESVTQFAPLGTEVIVVDDASSGGSVSQVAQTLAGPIIVRLPHRRGFSAAANAGIRVSRGQIIELLNDDTEVTAGWADKPLDHFRNPEVAAVAPLVLYRSECESQPLQIDSAGDRYYLGGVAGKRGHGRLLEPDYLHPRRVFGASASSAFYRRESLLRVGGFSESFRAYFEDVDLAFRLNRAGYQTVYEPTSRVFHRGSASHGRPRRRLLEQQSQNEERVFWRNLPASALGRAIPRHLAVLTAKAWRRWQEGNLIPFLCGRLRLLGELPTLIRHRRQLLALGSSFEISGWQVEPHFWA
jgi:GT2 family glycosyltransferase